MNRIWADGHRREDEVREPDHGVEACPSEAQGLQDSSWDRPVSRED